MFKTKKLEAEIERLNTEMGYYKGRADKAERESAELKNKTVRLNEDLKELKKQVRDQIHADMLVVALKAMGAIPDPDKLDYEKEMSRYRAQLARFQNVGMGGYQGNLGQAFNTGLFGGIGL